MPCCGAGMSAVDRQRYEAGGWADGRLGQAYDLIQAVLDEQHPEVDSHDMLKAARDKVEDADMEIARLEKGL
jgi:hypothetical protein